MGEVKNIWSVEVIPRLTQQKESPTHLESVCQAMVGLGQSWTSSGVAHRANQSACTAVTLECYWTEKRK